MPFLFFSTGAQGYGGLKDMPALYGLMWNHPNMLTNEGTGTQSMLAGGFEELWQRLLATTTVDVRVHSRITRIVRHHATIDIYFEGASHPATFDWLIMTAPMPQALDLLDAPTEEELELFSSFIYHQLVANVVNLTDSGALVDASFELFTWADRLDEQSDYYTVTRDRIGRLIQRQMIQSDGEDGPLTVRHTANILGLVHRVVGVLQVASINTTKAMLMDAIKSNLARYGLVETPLHQERWEYMPFKSLTDVVAHKMPWRMWQLNGLRRTWFTGSFTSFESVADVLDYNIQMVNQKLCASTTPRPQSAAPKEGSTSFMGERWSYAFKRIGQTVVNIIDPDAETSDLSVAFKVCGNYCGPGYCAGVEVSEEDCNFNVTSDSCADKCCELHDRCCAQEVGLIARCNGNFTACLVDCESHGTSRGQCIAAHGLAIPPTAISAAMRTVEDWCCGAPCPGAGPFELPFDFLVSRVMVLVSKCPRPTPLFIAVCRAPTNSLSHLDDWPRRKPRSVHTSTHTTPRSLIWAGLSGPFEQCGTRCSHTTSSSRSSGSPCWSTTCA